MLSSTGTDPSRNEKLTYVRSRWFLPSVLGIAALSEFLFNRLAQPILAALWGGAGTISTVATGIGRFSLNLSTVLGVMVLAFLLIRSTEPGGVASRPFGRVSVITIGALMCGLATLLILGPEGIGAASALRRALWLMGVCLSVLTALGILAQTPPQRPVRRMHKVGVLLLLLPPLLLLETQWEMFVRLNLLRYALLSRLYGSVVAVGALGIGAMFLSTVPPWPRAMVPILGALSATMGLTLMLHFDPGLAIRIIYMSFELRLPPNPEAYALYLLSLCTWTYAVLALLVGRPSRRVRGLGLLLIGFGGCQSRLLHQMLFYLTGLLCVLESLLDQAPAVTPRRLPRAQTSENSSMPSSAA